MAGKKKRPQGHKGPNRNALCPCGSGKAFKNCCARKRRPAAESPDSVPNQLKRMAVGLLVLVLIGGGIVLAVLRPWDDAGEIGATPKAWEYDTESDQYWNPDHGHWHEGKPPPPQERE